MPHSWQVRAATVLAGLNVVVGVGVLVVVGWSFTQDPGVLFAVYSAVAGAVASVGVWLTVSAISHTARLRKGAEGARLQTLVVGVSLLVFGLSLTVVVPWLGLLLVVDGAAMAALMLTTAAEQELGGWTTGTTLWPRRQRSHRLFAPRAAGDPSQPWWEVLEGQLSKGLPRADAVLAMVDGLLLAIMAGYLIRDGGRFGLASGFLLLLCAGLSWVLWRRIRARASAT